MLTSARFAARRRGVNPGVGGFREVVGESGLDPSSGADLEKLANLNISRQGGDVGFACGFVSAALAALLGGQAASPVSGPFRGCAGGSPRCGRHLCVVAATSRWWTPTSRWLVVASLGDGGLVEAVGAIAGLLVAERCRCPDSHGYL